MTVSTGDEQLAKVDLGDLAYLSFIELSPSDKSYI